jgi:hypothetical protein
MEKKALWVGEETAVGHLDCIALVAVSASSAVFLSAALVILTDCTEIASVRRWIFLGLYLHSTFVRCYIFNNMLGGAALDGCMIVGAFNYLSRYLHR